MKKLLSLLMITLIALGCYQLGRQPNSPDVVGWLKTELGRVDWPTVGRKTDGALQYARRQVATWCENQPSADSPAPAGQTPTPAKAPAGPQGLSSAEPVARRDEPTRLELPQCW